ncbi:MAG TPA: PspC domain-containing protein [Candidatus Paceibacterota bacterium]
MHKKLYRSETNKVFAGIIGGVGEYFDLDPTLLRLGYILIAIMTGIFPAIIAYIIAILIVPNKFHSSVEHTSSHHTPPKEEPKTEEKKEENQNIDN